MNEKEKTIETLSNLGIDFTLIEHEPIMTMAEGEDIARRLGVVACKNLFLINRHGDHFLLLLAGDKKLSTKSVAAQIGSGRLSFASQEDMNELLGVASGAVNILALANDNGHRVRLLIDNDVAAQPYMGCHPCVNTCSLKLRTDDILHKFLPATGHSDYTIVNV